MARGLGIKKRKRPLSNESLSTAKAIAEAIQSCGLSRSRLQEITGIDPGSISQISKGSHYGARLETIVDLLYAAGFVIKLEPIDPYKDDFYSERLHPNPPLPPRDEAEK
jgi:hypothetical protein